MTEPMEITASSNPIDIFNQWMDEVRANGQVREPTAMALATQDSSGYLHNRVVLCKSWSEAGFTFFTNYLSAKGQDLANHPFAGAVFYWDPLMRQVRISGRVEKVSEKESQDYWKIRPRESQLSQYISHQSDEVSSRAELERLQKQAAQELDGKEVPCPKHWGGYILLPKSMEFWVGQPGRLHDRFHFEKFQKAWTFRRLYP